LVSGNIVARDKALNSDVMSALRHSVVVAELTLSEVATSNNTGTLEPSPGSGNLATIATEREALSTVTAGSCVRNGEKLLESATRDNTLAVVESLSGTMGPAGTAVRLVTNVVNDGLALGPSLTSIECKGDVHVGGVVLLEVGGNSPFGINYSAHKLADFLVRSSGEFVILTSGPCSCGAVVNKLDVRGEVLGAFSKEHLGDGLLVTEFKGFASSKGCFEVNEFSLTVFLVDTGLESGENGVEGIKLIKSAIGGSLNGVLANAADEVRFGKVFVDLASVGKSDDGSSEDRAHI